MITFVDPTGSRMQTFATCTGPGDGMRTIPVRRMAPENIEDYFRYGKQIDADKRAPTACLTRQAEEWSHFGPRTEVVVCSRMPRGGEALEFTNTGYVLIDGKPKARTTVTREELTKNEIEVPYPVIDHTKK